MMTPQQAQAQVQQIMKLRLDYLGGVRPDAPAALLGLACSGAGLQFVLAFSLTDADRANLQAGSVVVREQACPCNSIRLGLGLEALSPSGEGAAAEAGTGHILRLGVMSCDVL